MNGGVQLALSRYVVPHDRPHSTESCLSPDQIPTLQISASLQKAVTVIPWLDCMSSEIPSCRRRINGLGTREAVLCNSQTRTLSILVTCTIATYPRPPPSSYLPACACSLPRSFEPSDRSKSAPDHDWRLNTLRVSSGNAPPLPHDCFTRPGLSPSSWCRQ